MSKEEDDLQYVLASVNKDFPDLNLTADDVVSTTLLSLDCPLLVCPAMNVRMWRNPAVQRNLATIQELGYEVLSPGEGHLACGHVGEGRLAEPPEIMAAAERILAARGAAEDPA